MDTQQKTYYKYIFIAFIGWFVFLGYVRGSTILYPDMKEFFTADNLQIGLLFTIIMFGFTAGSAIATPLITKFGIKTTGYACAAITTGSFIITAQIQPYQSLKLQYLCQFLFFGVPIGPVMAAILLGVRFSDENFGIRRSNFNTTVKNFKNVKKFTFPKFFRENVALDKLPSAMLLGVNGATIGSLTIPVLINFLTDASKTPNVRNLLANTTLPANTTETMDLTTHPTNFTTDLYVTTQARIFSNVYYTAGF